MLLAEAAADAVVISPTAMAGILGPAPGPLPGRCRNHASVPTPAALPGHASFRAPTPVMSHLAELATEYALPHEYKILDDDIEDLADGDEPDAGDTDDME